MKEFIITTKIELSDSEVDLLKKCKEQGYLEYRDNEHPTLEDFKKSLVPREIDWYLSRNEGGTLLLAGNLHAKGFLEITEAWNLTYELSEWGLEVLAQIIFRK